MVNFSILYPLKIRENQRFWGVFRGFKMGTLVGNGLKKPKDNLETKRTTKQLTMVNNC